MSDEFFHETVEHIDEVLARYEGEAFLVALRNRYGLSHIAYVALNLPGSAPTRPLVETTYSLDWQGHYVGNDYFAIDPVISNGLRGIVPVDWQIIDKRERQLSRFYGEAAEFGVGAQGLSFPIRGRLGETALFSLNSHVSGEEWRLLKRHCMRDFQILAYHFHTHVLERLGENAPEPVPLTQREGEVLKWAAAGKTSWETGMILGITQRTVDFHLENARVKLGCVNKIQTVAKAIRSQLI